MPPKKKKSGKKNLANMTEEERLIYLEQKRLAEEEMRKKKEEMLTQFLKVLYCYRVIRMLSLSIIHDSDEVFITYIFFQINFRIN